MANPTRAATIPTQTQLFNKPMERKLPPPILTTIAKAIEVIRDMAADMAYEKQLKQHGVGSPLKRPDGGPCAGTFKRVLKTNLPDRVALLSSPSKELKCDRARAIEVAEAEVRFLKEMQDGPHFPILEAAFEWPGNRYATIQRNIGLSAYDEFLDSNNPNRKSVDIAGIERIAKKLLESLDYMHKKGILHGDIKPENCSATGDLFDFGLSEEIGNSASIKKVFGIIFRPPETVLYNQTLLSGDIWALGCVFVELLRNQSLFSLQTERPESSLQSSINMLHAYQDRLNFQLPIEQFKNLPEFICETPKGKQLKPSTLLFPHRPLGCEFPISSSAHLQFRDLVSKMLDINPNGRISAEEALKHPFFTSPESTDLSFKLEVTGKRPMGMRILSHDRKVLTTMIDLTKYRPISCCHIDKSSEPYCIEFFDPARPDQVLSTMLTVFPGGRLAINTDALTEKSSVFESDSKRVSTK